MNKLIALCTFISVSFGNVLVCKNESTLYHISDRKGESRLYFVQDMLSSGECKFIYSYKMIYKGEYVSKVSYGDNSYYTLTAFVK
jgi:hypothetical protein